MWPLCHMPFTMSLCLSWKKSLKIHCSTNKGSGYLPIKCLKDALQFLVYISYLPQSPPLNRHCSPSTTLLEEASHGGWDWYPLWEVNISAMGVLSRHPRSCQPWARRLNYFEHCRCVWLLKTQWGSRRLWISTSKPPPHPPPSASLGAHQFTGHVS